jgi:gamma-glutamyltranspeptidase/glutathione hydrolase
MIVSGHPLATTAGFEALQEGGTVVDAAIAAAAVLAVVLPQACTVGGDAFMLIHRAAEGTFGLNGSGRCPAGVTADKFPDGVPQRGPNSAVVPSLVRAWHDAHSRFGRIEWPRLFARAIQHAREGFPLSDDAAQSIRANRALLESDPGCTDAFLRGGGLQAGEVFRQEALAHTLARIALEGPAGFYEGRVPVALGARVTERGGALRAGDFADVRTQWVAPLAVEYRGRTIVVMPPNSFGLLLSLQLKLIEREPLDWESAGDGERLALLVGAWNRAQGAGRRLIADPAFVPQASHVDIESVVARAAALPANGAGLPNLGGTAIVSVADRDGNGIVLVQSVFRAWGAAVLDPETGILLNNRLYGFSAERGHPNVIAPGKRPAHTLCPVMVKEGEALRYLTASPGGTGQTITVAQVLTNVFDRKMGLADAVAAPRWSSDIAGKLIAESTIPREALEALAARGFKLEPGPAGTPYFGSAQLIEIRRNGILAGAADRRREDCLLAQ